MRSIPGDVRLGRRAQLRAARRRELRVHHARVRVAGRPLDEPCLLEPSEEPRDSRRREQDVLREVDPPHAPVRPGEAQEHLVVVDRQPCAATSSAESSRMTVAWARRKLTQGASSVLVSGAVRLTACSSSMPHGGYVSVRARDPRKRARP